MAIVSLARILTLAAFLSVAAGVVCNKARVDDAVRRHLYINDPGAYHCSDTSDDYDDHHNSHDHDDDGDRAQSVSAITQLCGKKFPTSSWRQGTKVNGNCSKIPKYTAIGTFKNGKLNGHAAIFSRCVGSKIEVFDQWCGRHMAKRQKSGQTYYVIN